MSDPLELATRALRDAPVDHGGAAETRARLLAGASRKPLARGRSRLPWLVPVAAALVASAALAAGGARVTGWWPSRPAGAPQVQPRAPEPVPHAPSRVGVDEAAPQPRAEVPAREASAAATRAEDEVPVARDGAVERRDAPPAGAQAVPSSRIGERQPPPARAEAAPPARAEAAPPTRAEPTAARAEAAPSGRAEPTAAERADAATPTERARVEPAAPPAADPADELYRTAHELHFRGGAPSAAVAAWDRYLAAAPGGRFALEATFNRAVALLRAGRQREGLAALRPFASGAHGAYRRDEARRLLDAAGDAGAPP